MLRTESQCSKFVLAASYIIIIVNVQSNFHSGHHGPIQRERKLSVTLLIVTGVPVLTILPWTVYHSIQGHLWKKVRKASRVDIFHLLAVILLCMPSECRSLEKLWQTLLVTQRNAAHQSESFTASYHSLNC